MRTCQRNKRDIWYSLFVDVSNITDSDGNYTGEQTISYTTPSQARMNVSGGRGQADVDVFGIDNPFTHTATTDDLTTSFNTDSVFWFGVTPGSTASEIPHNFRCTGVSRTVNQVVLALAEVDLDAEDND